MQEQASKSLQQMTEIAAPTNTPSLDQVREKIERRYANALGAAELAQNSVQGRMLEVQQATVDLAGSARLEQIRASLGGGGGQQLGAGGTQQQLGGETQRQLDASAPREVTSGSQAGQDHTASQAQQQPNQG
jgi:phage shock protein A